MPLDAGPRGAKQNPWVALPGLPRGYTGRRLSLRHKPRKYLGFEVVWVIMPQGFQVVPAFPGVDIPQLP